MVNGGSSGMITYYTNTHIVLLIPINNIFNAGILIIILQQEWDIATALSYTLGQDSILPACP